MKRTVAGFGIATAALLFGPGPAGAGQTVIYKGMGSFTAHRELMPLANGGAAVQVTNAIVATIEPSKPGFIDGDCAGLGYLAVDGKYSVDTYCTFAETGEDAFDIRAKVDENGGSVEVIGGSGKWSGATGSGKLKSKWHEGALAGGEHALLEIVAATHSGMTTEEFEKIVRDWLATAKHPRTGRLYTEMVYQPMLELLAYLRANGFKTFIVSGGGIEFMRPWAEKVYGILPEQVIGSSGKTKFELRDGKPVLVKLPELFFFDDKAGKPVAIQHHIGRRPIAAFGNSDGDLQMLQWTTAGAGARFALIVHHTDAAREWAYDRKSHIGRLDKALDEATAKGWVVVDMKNAWKRVFAFKQISMMDSVPSSGLEGVEWRVVEVSGKPVAISAGERRPSVTFDAATKQATGYAGCNRFFGDYELNGMALKFGAVGATKRACPDLEEGLETEFFKAATRSWQIKDDTLLWLSGDRVLARFHPPQPQ